MITATSTESWVDRALELVDGGRCTPLCVMGQEGPVCRCRCAGQWHAYLRTGVESAPPATSRAGCVPKGVLPDCTRPIWWLPIADVPCSSVASIACRACGGRCGDLRPAVQPYLAKLDFGGHLTEAGWPLGWLIWQECASCRVSTFTGSDGYFIRQWGVRKWARLD